MRAVRGPRRCHASEAVVHLHAGPVYACVQRDRTVRNVKSLTRCSSSHPKRKGLTLPPTSRNVYFCRREGRDRGLLRYLTRPKRCPRGSELVYVPPRPMAANDSYRTAEDTALAVSSPGILGNDHSPTGRPLTPVLVSAPAHAASFALHADGSFSYRPAANFNGVDTFTYRVGDRLSGSDTAVAYIAVTAVNDAPAIAVSGARSTLEDTTLTFSHAGGDAITVADVDAGAAGVTVSLAAAHGALTLGGTAGLAFALGDGSADVSMSFHGTVAAVDAALDGLRFAPDPDYNGLAAVTIVTDDQGHTGSGGAHSAAGMVPVNVTAVNDAPVNGVPGAQAADDVSGLLLSTGTSNAISISDVDAGTNAVKVTLGVDHGTLTLGGNTGLTFSTGDGTADASMTFTGSVADVNAALNGTVYTTASGYTGPDTLTLSTDDQGNMGLGGALSDTDTVAITVGHVNVAPVNTVPGAQFTPAGTPIVFSGGGGNPISTADADAGAASVKVTLGVGHGKLTLSSTAGLSFVSGADGTGAMVFTGALGAVNTALAGLVYDNTAGYDGPDTLTVTTDDQGNTGLGGAQSDTDTVAITVAHVNVAPVNTVPGPQSAPAGTALVFKAANSNAISTADADAGASPVKVTLGVAHGTLTLSGTSGLTFVGGADGTGAMIFTGALSDVNTALAGLVYANTAGYDGPDTLTLTTDDQGNTGVGGALSDTDTVAITVEHVNVAPVNTVPGAQFTPAGTPLVFSSGGGNAISTADADAGAAAVQVTLGVAHGKLTLSSTTGLTFVSGADATGAMVFTGALSDVNTALAGLVYDNTPGYDGPDTLTFTTNDQGNTGVGGPLSDTDTVAITVAHVNVAPVNSVPGPQSTPAGTSLVFSSAGGNGLSTADADAGAGPVKVTLGVAHGTLTLSGTGGLTFVGGADGTGTMIFTGVLSDVNAALDGLTYAPTGGYDGPDTLTLTTDDQGNSGVGGPLSDTDTVAISIADLNVAPVNSVPGPQSTPDGTALVFSAANSNVIATSDADAGANPVKVTLGVDHGKLTLSGTAGLSFTSGANGTGAMAFTGALSNVNTALAGMSYDNTPGYDGPDTLTLTTNDQGNTGLGGALSDTDTVAITVAHLNVAPVNSVPGPQSTPGGTPIVFNAANLTAISTSDADAGTNPVKVTLGVLHGTLTLSTNAGLAFTVGDGTADASMTFTGTLSAVNTALSGMTYTRAGSYEGPDTLTFTTNDQGNTGAGGALSDTDTVAITVAHVNIAPVNSVPGPQTIQAGTALVFKPSNSNVITISDADAGTNPVKVTLGVLHGKLTLSGTAGLGFSAGDGTADASMTFTGSLSAVNTALNGLSYLSTLPYSGPETLTLSTDDQGNTGVGGSQTDTDTVAITVTPPPPVASDDSYTGANGAVGNTRLGVGTSPTGPAVTISGSVLDNDTSPGALTLSAGPAAIASTNGGTVAMNSDGTFTYLPPAGYEGTDTFDYTLTDANGTDTGTVSISVTQVVWYVNNSGAGPGDGRSNNPYTSLSSLQGAGDLDDPGDIVFVYQGTGTYAGGLPLENTQKLIGQPAGLTVAGHALVAAGGSNPAINNSGGAAITLAQGNTVQGVDVASAGGAGVLASGVDTATIGTTTPVALSGASGAELDVTGGNGTFASAATITNTTGRAVSIVNRAVGSVVTQSGPVSGSGTGVSLSGNAGTIAFTGGVTLSTGTNDAFTATGGMGSVTVTGAANTLATTSGRALNVTTNIGAAGLSFRSIAANGAASGIVLNGTGAAGGLTVTGTGAANSGGSIQSTTGPGIALTDTTSPSFNDVQILSTQRSGIKGTGVHGFAFTNGTISGAGAAQVDPTDSSIAFNNTAGGQNNNVDGAVTITGNSLTGAYGHGVGIFNYNGTISDATITGNTISSATTAATSKGGGVSINLFGSTTTVANLTKAMISNNAISNFPSGDGILIQGGNTASTSAPAGTYGTPGSATNVVSISGNTVRGDSSSKMNGSAILTGVAGRGQGNFTITNNGTAGTPLGNNKGETIAVGGAGSVTSNFAVTGNVIQANNTNNSPGIGLGVDINTQAAGGDLTNPTVNATVSNNTVSNTAGIGIFSLLRDSNGTLNLKLQSNTVGAPTSAGPAIEVDAGSDGDPGFNPTLCSNISGNTAAQGPNDGFGNNPSGIVIFKGSASAGTYRFGIVGLAPSPATPTQAESYLTGLNPGAALGAGFYGGKRVTATDGDNFTNCTLPF